MPTYRETILAALHARLSALPATALRGEVLPERVPADGLLILRDGEPGEPEVTLSPLRYHYQHRAEIESVVQGWFTFGTLDWTSGANAGRRAEVLGHDVTDGIAVLTLLEAPVRAISEGDGFSIRAGCDKRMETCGAKFANTVIHRRPSWL